VDHAWRSVLPKVLAAAAGTRGLVVDVRSAPYQSIGRPAGLEDRTVTLRIRPEAGARTIGDVIAKRVRGEVARHLLESGASPDDPGELAAVVDERWPARLEPPTGRTQPWTLVVRPSA
jgi:cytoplasmic iron level regulating protein YaaA (DUF328/UPF0246 family)